MRAVGQGSRHELATLHERALALDGNWERAHFEFGSYLDQLYSDAKQRQVEWRQNFSCNGVGLCDASVDT